MLLCRHAYGLIEPLVSKTYSIAPSIKQQQQQQKLRQQRLKKLRQQRLKQQRLKKLRQLKKLQQKKQLSSMPEFKGRAHIVESSYGGANYF
jgi:hypothetical protein